MKRKGERICNNEEKADIDVDSPSISNVDMWLFIKTFYTILLFGEESLIYNGQKMTQLITS
jgi:hypothetical protein